MYFDIAAPSVPTPSGSSVPWLLIGAAVILAAVVLIVIVKKKNK